MSGERAEVTTSERGAKAPQERRFEFGHNWRSFLEHVDETRIDQAQQALCDMLQVTSLTERAFLDAGCGSGLASLAARRLGARVCSFDLDSEAVACTRELRRRYAPEDAQWTVLQGSVLERAFVPSLGTFDVVYSWGVLHHTGAMWQALDRLVPAISAGGCLFISIYNDQGIQSTMWRSVKRAYNRLPRLLRPALCVAVAVLLETGAFCSAVVSLRPLCYVRSRVKYRSRRGMSWWHDMVDWVGGYPFEVARPEAIVEFYRLRGLVLFRATTVGTRLGCNEFVFRRLRE